MNSVFFRFYAELNDFLNNELRFKRFEYRFLGKPSVKDAIEALGVPHTEVDLVVVNNEVSGFEYNLKDGDFVAVYPVFESIDISNLKDNKPLREIKFVADVHLGRLARFLRILGFDTLYRNDFSDSEIINISNEQNRIVLTRDIGILKNGRVEKGYFVRNTESKEQVKEVVARFDLFSLIKPFSRCPVCNGELISVPKSRVLDKLPQKTKEACSEFKMCGSCGKIYWRGTHYRKIKDFIESLKVKP